ncbi:MAG TPA: hypothetical protein VM364_13775 [Vicinamibacterales bacterium]|nr:hypothetical protein [Vicinamibacterales bacterium]
MIAAGPAGSESRTQGVPLFGIYLLSLGASLVGNLVIRVGAKAGWLGEPERLAVALLSVAPLVVAAMFFWRMLRKDLDEMQQRIVLEGMAFALTLFVPVAALVVNVRTAGAWMPRFDAFDILMTPAFLVAIGIAIASRRYQ